MDSLCPERRDVSGLRLALNYTRSLHRAHGDKVNYCRYTVLIWLRHSCRHPAEIERGACWGQMQSALREISVVRQVQRVTDTIATYLDLITASRARAAGLLVFVALCAFSPGFNAIPPVDRDEPRYAQASKQMMETGNYLDIRFQEQPRYLQPAGLYWLQVTAAKITGYGPEAPIWVYRLPSLLAATAAVVLTYWVALPLAGPVGAFIAALLLTPCILLGVEARLAKTDASVACLHPERDRISGARLFASNYYASRGGSVLDSLRCRNPG